jgi:hypothetical protein
MHFLDKFSTTGKMPPAFLGKGKERREEGKEGEGKERERWGKEEKGRREEDVMTGYLAVSAAPDQCTSLLTFFHDFFPHEQMGDAEQRYSNYIFQTSGPNSLDSTSLAQSLTPKCQIKKG